MKAFRNFAQIATLQGVHQKDGRKLLPQDLSILSDASLIFDQDKILWVGEDKNFPSDYSQISFEDFSGHVMLPELVDSHTHAIFGGDRANEYSRRLNGEDYVEISKAGGGILNTMNGTRNLSNEKLFDDCVERLERIYSYGVGTVEVKSGYGLSYHKEYALSHVIQKVKEHFKGKLQVINTFMAAHAIPPEFNTSLSYLEEVCFPLMETLQSEEIIDCVDIFHEQGYFSNSDTELFFKKAVELKVPIKSHADEFNDNKGAVLAAKYKALSADHLLCTGKDGIKALAKSSTVATLLPGTGMFLGKSQADARAFLDAGAKLAIASDYNPGSCHCDNVLLLASISAPLLKLNMCEMWAAITYNAAHALGLKNQGVLAEGKLPRFSIFKTDSIDRITYNWGRNLSIRG